MRTDALSVANIKIMMFQDVMPNTVADITILVVYHNTEDHNLKHKACKSP
jgi:hypothetical protein